MHTDFIIRQRQSYQNHFWHNVKENLEMSLKYFLFLLQTFSYSVSFKSIRTALEAKKLVRYELKFEFNLVYLFFYLTEKKLLLDKVIMTMKNKFITGIQNKIKN